MRRCVTAAVLVLVGTLPVRAGDGGDTRGIRSPQDFAAAVRDAPEPREGTEKEGVEGLGERIAILAASDSAEVRAAARRMVDVLLQHKVAVPEALRKIEVGDLPKERGDREWQALARMVRVTDRIAKLWTKKDHGIPPGVGREIFEGLAKDGPGAYTRAQAAGFLTAGALTAQGLADSPLYEPVPVESARQAWAQAMEACLDLSSGALPRDGAALLWLTALGWGKSFQLELAAPEQTEKELRASIEQRVARVDELLTAAEQSPSAAEAKPGLEALRKVLPVLRPRAELIAEWVVSRREMEAVLRTFAAAMNREDKAGATACVAAKDVVEKLNQAESLRDLWGGSKGVREVRIVKVRVAGSQIGRLRTLQVDLAIVDATGKETPRVWEDVGFVKVDGQWKMDGR